MTMGWLDWLKSKRVRTVQGFLTRLRRDVRGNTLAIAGAALIPLAGMVGGGIDMSRMYITKTRLQHACDAGVLAGRKSMGGGTWNSDDDATAKRFFDANFQSGAYGSNTLARSFSESGGTVSGTASAILPLTLMRVLGKNTETLAVMCDADMRLPNTDVMFVLDTTGSMGDIPAGDSKTKMASLKESVKCFFEIVARLDTDATCTTGTPSGGLNNRVQVRFGFVPYATNVNVGRLLRPAWFADSANYQTREAQFEDETTTSGPNVIATEYRNPDPRAWAVESDWTNVSSNFCNSQAVPADSGFTAINPEGNQTETSTSGTNPRTTTYATYQYGRYTNYRRAYDSGQRRCQIQRRIIYADLRRTYRKVDTTASVFKRWKYSSLPVDVSLLKNGSAWNTSFDWPINAAGTDRTINWGGCIEERQTVSQASYSPIPSGAKDLDIDTVPSSGDATTQWRPVLPDLIYTRSNNSGWTTQDVYTANDLGSDDYYACPREAKKLQSWPNVNDFDDYVDTLFPEGNTYHDIGLIWGARLLSPTGIFASENATTPDGAEIERHMIFMTDGDTCTGINNYTAYGVNWFDRRTTGSASAPSDGCTTNGTLTQQVNARSEAVCTAVKNKNITLWVIAFGNLATSTETRLQNCATSGRYFKATNAATLQATFKDIANQISQLRLTK